MQLNKPLEDGYGIKSQCISINKHLSKLQDFHQSRRKKRKKIFSPFGNEFLPSPKHIILKDHPIRYQFKKGYI